MTGQISNGMSGPFLLQVKAPSKFPGASVAVGQYRISNHAWSLLAQEYREFG